MCLKLCILYIFLKSSLFVVVYEVCFFKNLNKNLKTCKVSISVSGVMSSATLYTTNVPFSFISVNSGVMGRPIIWSVICNFSMPRNALMETDGTSEVMTIMQMFTKLFLQAHQNENKQVSQDLLLSVFFQWKNAKFHKTPIVLFSEVTEYNEVNNSIPL